MRAGHATAAVSVTDVFGLPHHISAGVGGRAGQHTGQPPKSAASLFFIIREFAAAMVCWHRCLGSKARLRARLRANGRRCMGAPRLLHLLLISSGRALHIVQGATHGDLGSGHTCCREEQGLGLTRALRPCFLFPCTQARCSGLGQLPGVCQILPIMIFGAGLDGAAEEQQMHFLNWSFSEVVGRHCMTSKGPHCFMSCS